MKGDITVKTWEKTRLQNLVRHKSGRYYARLYLHGKEVWKSLKTSHFSVAEARLATLQKEHRQQQKKTVGSTDARMTFDQAASLHLKRVDEDASLKRLTKSYWHAVNDTLLKTWPGLAEAEVRRLTPAGCREWAARYAKTASATRFNGAISHLRRVLEIAIESGVIYANPATGLSRKSVRAKRLELPTRAQFSAFIAEMRAGHSRDSLNCADFVEGLAYLGCRISEAAQIEWRDLAFSTNEVLIKGDPEEATKNGEIRYIPMIPNAQELFFRMRQQRIDEHNNEKVFLVQRSQKSMNRAASKIGMARITHHDLRHFFATICIESGVDIPTVSRWLGHKDGGALAMRTYGHLRREHSAAQAQKVSFAPVEPNTTTATFAESIVPARLAAGKVRKATEPKRLKPAESWTASLDGERSKSSAKRSRGAAREL